MWFLIWTKDKKTKSTKSAATKKNRTFLLKKQNKLEEKKSNENHLTEPNETFTPVKCKRLMLLFGLSGSYLYRNDIVAVENGAFPSGITTM